MDTNTVLLRLKRIIKEVFIMQQQQQTPVGQQQHVMPQPPNVISTRDQLFITDMLNWNLNAMKKCHFFADQCQDQEIKTLLNKAGQMHQRHYGQILNYLQPTAQQAQQTFQ